MTEKVFVLVWHTKCPFLDGTQSISFSIMGKTSILVWHEKDLFWDDMESLFLSMWCEMSVSLVYHERHVPFNIINE